MVTGSVDVLVRVLNGLAILRGLVFAGLLWRIPLAGRPSGFGAVRAPAWPEPRLSAGCSLSTDLRASPQPRRRPHLGDRHGGSEKRGGARVRVQLPTRHPVRPDCRIGTAGGDDHGRLGTPARERRHAAWWGDACAAGPTAAQRSMDGSPEPSAGPRPWVDGAALRARKHGSLCGAAGEPGRCDPLRNATQTVSLALLLPTAERQPADLEGRRLSATPRLSHRTQDPP